MDQNPFTRQKQWVQLNGLTGFGPLRLQRLIQAFGDVSRLWAADLRQLQQVEGMNPHWVERLIEARQNGAFADEELALVKKAKAGLITLDDAAYPPALKKIIDPPTVLYVQGSLDEADSLAVAIVGCRHPSLYGLECAERLGYDLALRGITVVSGLARGIDAAAHRGALKAKGRTIAVLGSGIGRIYPPEHESLADEISKHGAVVSEFPMKTAPLPQHFPQRNRIISGLSLGVVVVEAAGRSGSLITADAALEQGREVFAVPGQVTQSTSVGTNALLKQGARMVTSVEDILDELRLVPQSLPAVEKKDLTQMEQQILDCIQAKSCNMDAIVQQSGFACSEVSATLLQLELKRWVRQLPGKRFEKCN